LFELKIQICLRLTKVAKKNVIILQTSEDKYYFIAKKLKKIIMQIKNSYKEIKGKEIEYIKADNRFLRIDVVYGLNAFKLVKEKIRRIIKIVIK